jgi:subtilase family serine protease
VGADLVVSAVAGPTSPVVPGQAITITDTTRNQGTLGTTVNTMTRFYLSTNTVWDAADVPLGERVVGPVAAGSSNGPVVTTITIPSTAPAGSYYLIARADAGDGAAEASETNNVRYTTVTVSP